MLPQIDNSDQKQTDLNQLNDKNVMVLWDFDWSLINGNSDFYVFEKLFGVNAYNVIYSNLRKKAKNQGVTVFTDFMDQYAWPLLFDKFKLNKLKFTKCISDIPIFPENLHIVKTLHNHNNNNKIEQYIVSDANTVLIETILVSNNISNIIPSNNIYTNPGWYDNKTGVIRCKRYHAINNPHNCLLNDSLNICKGKILNEEILKNKNTNNLIKIYIGDGGGDYCPVTYFNENDFVFVREYPYKKGLEKKIDKNDGIVLKCNVMKWKNGKDLLECFKKVLPKVSF